MLIVLACNRTTAAAAYFYLFIFFYIKVNLHKIQDQNQRYSVWF